MIRPANLQKDQDLTDLDTYLQRAAEAEGAADIAILANVRERHLTAARTWHALADKLRAHNAMRDKLMAEKEAAKTA